MVQVGSTGVRRRAGGDGVSGRSRHRIGILLFDDVKMLDFAGPAEVFTEANQSVGGYDLTFVSPDGKPVHTSIGVTVSVSGTPEENGGFDTVIVPGSECAPPSFVTPQVLAATSSLIRGARRVTSICSGAFVLAALGLLDGKRAATHWKFTRTLARQYPRVLVEPDSIFVRDGSTYTSAGVAAGMDLALALVEEDHGADVARRVAQGLLVYMQRAGGQSQFSASLQGPAPRTPVVRSVTDLIQANPGRQYSAQDLADHALISVRHLSRLFREELDTTPMEYVATLRFDQARSLLDAGTGVSQAAAQAGYGDPEGLRRAFISRLGISPLKYQRRFRSTVNPPPGHGS
jgi:transcriptional regulator GlxA family with amidase domain